MPIIAGGVGKRFFPALSLALLFWGIGWPFLTLGFVNHYGVPESTWIEGQYRRKDLAIERSAQSPGPRLLIVGGSEALFGVDAQLIQRKLGITTINYGTHADLGTYLLDRARRALRPGDSVLLCPAYEIWYEDGISDAEWDYFSTYDKRFFFSSGTGNALRTLYSVPGYSYFDSLVGWWKRATGRYQDEWTDYNLATVDANGDLRGPIWPGPFNPGGASLFPRQSQDVGANAEFHKFAQWARQNRVRVFYSWPNRCRPEPPAPEDRFIPPGLKTMFNAWGFILLNQPEDTWYPRQWFMDTIYHPDAGCRRVRTEALIRALRPYFNLPPVSPSPKGIYLVSGRTVWLNDANAFAGRPDVWAKYLTSERLDSSDAITPVELRQWCARGVPIWYDDPAIESLLPAGQWQRRQINKREESIGDWVRRYDHHLFLFARARGPAPDATPLATELLPSDARAALGDATPAIVVVGTGPWSGVRRVISKNRAAIFHSSLEKLVGQSVPHLGLSLRADAGGAEGCWIAVNGRRFSASRDGEICTVVIEPNEGVVVDAATFADGAAKVVWQMKQLFPRQPSPGPVPAR